MNAFGGEARLKIIMSCAWFWAVVALASPYGNSYGDMPADHTRNAPEFSELGNRAVAATPSEKTIQPTPGEHSVFLQSPMPLTETALLPLNYLHMYHSTTPGDGTAYESFSGVQGPYSILEWWGVTGTFHYDGDYWTPSTPDTNTFIIKFCEDANGIPGAVVHQETVNATRVDGPGTYSCRFYIHGPYQFPIQRYRVKLASPVMLESGFVSVRQVLTSTSVFLWMTSPDGDGKAMQEIRNMGFSWGEPDLAVGFSAEDLSCSFASSSRLVQHGEAVGFHGTVTGDMGENVTWHWDFGDGTTVTGGPDITHTYASVGDYAVSVTASTPTRSATQSAGYMLAVVESLPASSKTGMAFVFTALMCIGALALLGRKPSAFRR